MSSSFDRNVGPRADIKELEYIAALQQTCATTSTRPSGTISALDVSRYLKSRYAIGVTSDQASDIVLGLGGGRLSPSVRHAVTQGKVAQQRYTTMRQKRLKGRIQQQIDAQKAAKKAAKKESENNNNARSYLSSSASSSLSPRHAVGRLLKVQKKESSSSSSEDQQGGEVVEVATTNTATKEEEDFGASVASGMDVSAKEVSDGDDDDDDDDDDNNNNDDNNNDNENDDNNNDNERKPHQDIDKSVASASLASQANVDEDEIANSYFATPVTRNERRALKKLEKENDELEKLIEEMQHPKLEYLDIVELAGILLIPTIARMGQKWKDDDQQKKDGQVVAAHPDYAHCSKNPPFSELGSAIHQEMERIQDSLKTMIPSTPTPSTDNIEMAEDGSVAVPSDTVDQQTNENNSHKKLKRLSSLSLGGPSSHGQIGLKSNSEGKTYETSHYFQPHIPQMSVFQTAGDDDDDDNEEDPMKLDPPDGLLEFILRKLWKIIATIQAGNDSASGHLLDLQRVGPPVLTAEVVELLMMSTGDTERVQDPALIQAMVDAARSPTGLLDAQAFVNALTNDIAAWEVGVEDRQSSYVYDVFHDDNLGSFQRQYTRKSVSESVRRSKRSRHHDEESLDQQVEEGYDGAPGCGEGSARVIPDEDGHEKTTYSHPAIVPMGEAKDINAIQEAASANFELSIVKVIVHDTESDLVQVHAKSGKVIDFVIDSFGSFTVVVLIWTVFLCSAATYGSMYVCCSTIISSLSRAMISNFDDGSFGCTLAITIISWLIIAVMLVILGYCVFVPLAFGNHPTDRRAWRQFFATTIAGVETVIPTVVVLTFAAREESNPATNPEKIVRDDNFLIVVYTGLASGGFLTLIYFFYFLVVERKEHGHDFSEGRVAAVLAQSANERGTSQMKRAATRKINKMFRNARRMHGDMKETDAASSLSMSKTLDFAQGWGDDQAVFQTYVLYGEDKERCASWIWVFKRMFSRELFEMEGIWLPSRMWTFQYMQIVLLIVLEIALRFFINAAIEAADQATEDIANLPEGLSSWIYTIAPSADQVKIAFYPAEAVALSVAISIVLLYIPSTVSTILKFRCGVNASLGSESFQLNRNAVDCAYMNTANAIYGMLGAFVLFFFIIGLFIFLFIWDFSRGLMLTLLAWGIGLTITIVLKMIVTMFCRHQFYRAFFRTRPLKANISSLALECWYIGLGGGVLIGRICQFLLAAAFWIGRIDEPFLAPNVGLLGYRFDYVPLNYTKEILVHEAHRHPFIERIGAMYLMRLRNKDFGSREGACWRQIFLVTFMPWIMKYRVLHEQRSKESLADQTDERQIEFEESEDPGQIMNEEMKHAREGMIGTGQFVADIGKVAVVDVPTQAVKQAKSVVQFVVPPSSL